MTLLYYDPIVLEHDTGDHPECAARILPTVRQLNQIAMHLHCSRPAWDPANDERLERVHVPEYLEQLRLFVAQGGGRIEQDTMVSPRSMDAARVAAGAVCDAVRRVVQESAQKAFCLIRPPGHHALANAPMGFCLLNNVAVGARLAIEELTLDRVLIVDWDVHHGNGTQAIFWEDPQVAFFSIHRHPFYPGTGRENETGSGPGLGTVCNVPIEYGTSRPDYLSAFRTSLTDFADRMRPQLILISAGFDAHRDDPIGSLGLESEDFAELTRVVMDVANVHAQGRIVSVLEGGYNPRAVCESVEHHLQELLAEDV